ncbi:MAG: hypothetical protein JWP08_84 [Bryobacterales bacterium]|nr:hypothetical protein [Bryobacterales bacterium]
MVKDFECITASLEVHTTFLVWFFYLWIGKSD